MEEEREREEGEGKGRGRRRGIQEREGRSGGEAGDLLAELGMKFQH